MQGLSGDLGFKGFSDILHCISHVHVWEECPCMHIHHMQMDWELLCVLSEFRRGVIWTKNPPGNVGFASTGPWAVIWGGERSGNEGEVH